MKKSHIVTGAVALAVLVTAAGAASTVLAASNNNFKMAFDKFLGKPGQELTDAQKAEMKTKMEAVNAALEAGDYTAWVTAEKAIDANSPMLEKVTADNFSDYVAKYKERETKMAEEKTKRGAVNAALEAGDYTAWVTAEKAINANSSVLEKINADNFSDYVNAKNLRQQADTIIENLGLGKGDGMDGRDHGMPGGFGPGGLGGPRDQEVTDNN
jgi:hypothetical protein